jgi:hypothetical protein
VAKAFLSGKKETQSKYQDYFEKLAVIGIQTPGLLLLQGVY